MFLSIKKSAFYSPSYVVSFNLLDVEISKVASIWRSLHLHWAVSLSCCSKSKLLLPCTWAAPPSLFFMYAVVWSEAAGFPFFILCVGRKHVLSKYEISIFFSSKDKKRECSTSFSPSCWQDAWFNAPIQDVLVCLYTWVMTAPCNQHLFLWLKYIHVVGRQYFTSAAFFKWAV